MSFDPLFALLVIAVLALPYLIWLIRAETLAMPPLPAVADLSARAVHWGVLLVFLLAAMTGIVVLVVLNSRPLHPQPGRGADHLPAAGRSAGPPFRLLLRAGAGICRKPDRALFNLDRVVGGAGIALMMSGLAVIVATGDLVHLRRQRLLRSVWAAVIVAPALATLATTLFLPWAGTAEVPTSLPATAIGRFFGDSFERRTNRPLRAVAGDAQIATLIAMDSSRPHLFLDATPARTPWLNPAKFNETRRRRGLARIRYRRHAAGRTRQTFSRHRAGTAARLRADVTGRQGLLRIGWAIVRPKSQ